MLWLPARRAAHGWFPDRHWKPARRLPRPLRLARSGGPRSPVRLMSVATALTCVTARRWTAGQRFPEFALDLAPTVGAGTLRTTSASSVAAVASTGPLGGRDGPSRREEGASASASRSADLPVAASPASAAAMTDACIQSATEPGVVIVCPLCVVAVVEPVRRGRLRDRWLALFRQHEGVRDARCVRTGLPARAATRPAGLIRPAVPGKALVVQVVEEGGEQFHPVWLHGRVQQPPQLVDRSLPLLQGELVQHPIEMVGVHGRSLLLEPLIKLLSQPTARPNRGAIVARQQPGRRGGAGEEHGATSRRSAASFQVSCPVPPWLGRAGSVGSRLRRSSVGLLKEMGR